MGQRLQPHADRCGVVVEGGENQCEVGEVEQQVRRRGGWELLRQKMRDRAGGAFGDRRERGGLHEAAQRLRGQRRGQIAVPDGQVDLRPMHGGQHAGMA